jgi:serine/threonine protein kinase
MLCNACGKENRPEARFCDGCGSPLDATVTKSGIDPELDAVRRAFHERFIVESLLGRGGMGAVYKARERALDRTVALKIVPEHRAHDVQLVERFRREARTAARLRHPRIVSVHEVGMMGPFPYFSMDFIEGGTLRSVVQRRRSLSAEDSISIVTEVCRAVGHAHTKGVVHRDLKPENVMIDNEGDVFVMDFGLARVSEEPALTQSGAIMGTPFYMSPEQLSGGTVDERSDIYSIGLILYYCLTGDDLFAADSIPAVIAKHANIRIDDVIEAHSLLPPNLQDVLRSMLEEDLIMRARSVREVAERLTLRKIVALGIAATEENENEVLTLVTPPPVTIEAEPIAVENAAIASFADRRKARLRSLLEEL